MGRFELSGNKEKIKAAARSTKEREQSSKRREDDSTSLPGSPIRRKRSRTSQDVVDDSTRQSIPPSVIVGASTDKGKGVVEAIDMPHSSSPPMRLPAFFEEIKNSFSRSSPTRATDGSLNFEQKFHMTFDKTATVNAFVGIYRTFLYISH